MLYVLLVKRGGKDYVFLGILEESLAVVLDESLVVVF